MRSSECRTKPDFIPHIQKQMFSWPVSNYDQPMSKLILLVILSLISAGTSNRR